MLIILSVLIMLDIVSGVIMTCIFKKSPKTASGAFSSEVGYKSVFKKLGIYIAVIIGHLCDVCLDVNFIRTAVIFYFIANEMGSIIENLTIIGVPMPPIICDAIDVIKSKGSTRMNESAETIDDYSDITALTDGYEPTDIEEGGGCDE